MWGAGGHIPCSTRNPYKMLKETELNFRIVRVIGLRTFVQIKIRTKPLALEAVEERLVGYSSDSKSFRVYNPIIQRIMESSNAIFNETTSRLLPPPLRAPQLLMQELPDGDEPDDDNKGYYCIIHDDVLRDFRNYTSVIDHPGSVSINHVTASGRSKVHWWLNFSTGSAQSLGKIFCKTVPCMGERLKLGGVPQGSILKHTE